MKNILAKRPDASVEEQFETLLTGKAFRVERIVSHGQSSPAGFWYDQPQDEWVLVMRGQAKLEFAGEPEPLTMQPGDCVHITAHRKHRVAWTSADEPTIWLAIHFDA